MEAGTGIGRRQRKPAHTTRLHKHVHFGIAQNVRVVLQQTPGEFHAHAYARMFRRVAPCVPTT